MAGLLASLSVGRAWEKLTSFIRAFSSPSAPSTSCFSSQDDLEELMKLKRTVDRIRAVLHDAEEHWNIREESSKLKLQELMAVAYDMEDVVEEYEYEINRCKVEALERCAGVNNTNKRKRQEPFRPPSKKQNEVYQEDIGVVAVPKELVDRARKITARFNEIIDFSDRFTLSENVGERRFSHDISDWRHTSSFVVQKSILGRDQDKQKIVEKLLSGEGKNVGSCVYVLAIVGMGGLGKTTLAQLVYNSPRVRQSFAKHAWVCVSDPFNVTAITRNIINSLTSGTCEYTELADLHRKLADEIKDKRVLLVLDDVWNEQRDCWDSLCTPMSVARICQIILTTRSKTVAKLVQTMDTYHMTCLTSDDSWSLFKQAAFSSQEPNTSKKLKDIGKKIVQKCNGLPLAIKTVGSMLHYETDENIWEDVLENELFELEQTWNEVLPVLHLCYKHIPIYLKPCFIALSLYPKGSSPGKYEIIRLWKFLDLLNCNISYDKDETGSLYLKEIVQRSILQTEEHFNDDKPPYKSSWLSYHMHDLVHDLVCFLSDGEFYRLEGDTSVEIPQKVRYISVPSNYGKPIEIPILPHSLRAFIMFDDVEIIIPESLFLSCKNLRALDLRQRSFAKALAGSVGSLKLIRHLALEGGGAEFTSISLLQSYNLQTLEHVLWSAPYNPVPHEIGHLINLRTLGLAISMCGCCGCNIRELRNINKITDLTISGLGGVSCIKDANEAQMQSKRQLRSLCLDFALDCTSCQHNQRSAHAPVSQDQLLESLQPHRNLTELTIRDYKSHEYPSWLGNDAFSKLTRINLAYCESKHLPPLGGLPSLKYLIIRGMWNVEHIGQEFIGHPSNGFPSLTDMEFDGIYNWLEWSVVDESDFVSLDTLSIHVCNGLKSLPSLPSLVTVNLYICHGIATVPAWSTLCKLRIDFCNSLSVVPTLPSLLDLCIGRCFSLTTVNSQPSLTSMELESINMCSVDFGSLSSLTSLKLTNDLQRFEKQFFGKILKYELYTLFYDLTSLECLEIYDDPATSLRLKQQSVPSLTKLCLLECRDLQYCDGLADLTSLQHLEVRGCPKLVKNNLHLPQLKTLMMDDE